MLQGLATAHAGASRRAMLALGRHCSTTHPSQSASQGTVHSHLAGAVRASFRASGIEQKESCPTTCATSPLLVDRDCSCRNWSVYQDSGPRWVGPHGPALASIGQQAPAPAQGGESGGGNLEFRLLCSSKDAQDSNGRFGTPRLDHVPNTSQRGQHRSVARFQDSEKFKHEVSGELSAVSQDSTKAVVWQPTTTLSLSHDPKQAGNNLATCRGDCWHRTVVSAPAHKRMTGKQVIDVFGGSGAHGKSDESLWVCVASVLDTKFWIQV